MPYLSICISQISNCLIMFDFIAYIIVFRLEASKLPEYSRVVLVKRPQNVIFSIFTQTKFL